MFQIKPSEKILKYFRYKVLYLKHCHRFMFAHKPLCEKFKNDTISVFGVNFCRSCFCLYLGLICSFLFSFHTLSATFVSKNIINILAVFFSIVALSSPKLYKKYSRIQRDIIRTLNGVVIGFIVFVLFKINILIASILIALSFLVKRNYQAQRRKIDICSGCLELLNAGTCSGYKKQVQALLKFEEDYSSGIKIRKEFLYDK